MIKKIFDFVFGFILLILLSPVLFGVGVLVYIFIGHPVLFVQARPGYKGKIFNLYKFRTMKNLNDQNGKSLPDDQRLTKFGRILRKTSLDELPEVINVLRGEMSFVGPRPLLVDYLPLYTSEQARRHDVLPGITGLAQVSGRNNLEWDKRFDLDVYYVDHRTMKMDFQILFKTIFKVIGAKDVEQKGQATMSKFEGNQKR